MLQFLLVALLASVAVGKEAEPAETKTKSVPAEAGPSESAAKTSMKDAESVPMPYNHHDLHDHHDHGNDHLYLRAKLDGPESPREGPLVARNLHPSMHGHGPNIAVQDEIIKFTYSPAYYEPMWVLDYRFLKSGGRRYTRGPGGQVLILPKSYRHHKGDGTGDYDELVEFWRLKLIAEQNKRMRENGFGHVHDHGHVGQHHVHERDRLHAYGEHMHELNHLNPGREHMNMGRENMNMGRDDMNMGRDDMNMGRENMYRERQNVHRERENMQREREHIDRGEYRHRGAEHLHGYQ